MKNSTRAITLFFKYYIFILDAAIIWIVQLHVADFNVATMQLQLRCCASNRWVPFILIRGNGTVNVLQMDATYHRSASVAMSATKSIRCVVSLKSLASTSREASFSSKSIWHIRIFGVNFCCKPLIYLKILNNRADTEACFVLLSCKTASRRVALRHVSLQNAIAAVTYCETSSIINGSIIGEMIEINDYATYFYAEFILKDSPEKREIPTIRKAALLWNPEMKTNKPLYFYWRRAIDIRCRILHVWSLIRGKALRLLVREIENVGRAKKLYWLIYSN